VISVCDLQVMIYCMHAKSGRISKVTHSKVVLNKAIFTPKHHK